MIISSILRNPISNPISAVLGGGGVTLSDDIRLEGDSLMAGAYGFSTKAEFTALVPNRNVHSTAVGGSTMDNVKTRVLDPTNSEYLSRIHVFFDGSWNGLTTVTEYVDLLADAIAALGHTRFVVIPAIQPYGSSDTGSTTPELIRDEMVSRWPDNVMDWRDYMDHTGGAIASSEFHDSGSDAYHFSQVGHAHVALGLLEFMQDKGWIADRGHDQVLADGSLLLIDPSNSEGSFTGVPAVSNVLPNVAHVQAAAIHGSGNASTLGMTTGIDDTNSGLDYLVERTTKGGFHGMTTQDRSFVGQSSQGMYFVENSTLRDYIHNNSDHEFYISLWATITRNSLVTTPGGVSNIAPQSPFHRAQNTSNYNWYMQRYAPFPNNQLGTNQLPDDTEPLDTPLLRAVGLDAPTGTISQSQGLFIALGSQGGWGYFNNGAAPSWILYRAYIEDLTVSGRSYSDVEALDAVLWRNAFSNIGAFGNDTYSDPEVVMP